MLTKHVQLVWKSDDNGSIYAHYFDGRISVVEEDNRFTIFTIHEDGRSVVSGTFRDQGPAQWVAEAIVLREWVEHQEQWSAK